MPAVRGTLWMAEPSPQVMLYWKPAAVSTEDGSLVMILKLRTCVASANEYPLVRKSVNVVPTPTLLRTNGYSFALATQVLNFRIITSDPSSVDTAAGFQYSITWGDGSAIQSVPRTAGIVNLTHVYAAAGTYTASYTATDKDNGVSATRTFVTTAYAVTSD